MTEVTPVNKFTRRVAREYKRLLYINIHTKTDQNGEVDVGFDPYSKELADEYLVKELFGLENIDDVDEKEYQKMLQDAEKVRKEAFL